MTVIKVQWGCAWAVASSIGKMGKEEEKKKNQNDHFGSRKPPKKRKAYQALKATQERQALLQEKEQRKWKEFQFKWLEWFLNDSWQQLHDRVHLRWLEGKPHGLKVPDKPFLAFVVGIQRINVVSLLVQSTIARLCLSKIFSGIFV